MQVNPLNLACQRQPWVLEEAIYHRVRVQALEPACRPGAPTQSPPPAGPGKDTPSEPRLWVSVLLFFSFHLGAATVNQASSSRGSVD